MGGKEGRSSLWGAAIDAIDARVMSMGMLLFGFCLGMGCFYLCLRALQREPPSAALVVVG